MLRRTRLLPALAASALLVTAAVSGAVATAAPAADVRTAPAVTAATTSATDGPDVPGVATAPELTSLFSQYGNGGTTGTGYAKMCATWSGADGTHSIPLPGDRRLWSFSDTYLGDPALRVNGFDTSFINNSMLVESAAGGLRTVTGGNTCQERSGGSSRNARSPIVPPAGVPGWYWNADGMLVGDRVVKFHYRQVARPVAWEEVGWGVTSQPVSAFGSDAMTVEVAEKPVREVNGTPITWGTALLPGAGSEVFVYGRASTPGNYGRLVFLARVADRTTLTDFSSWRFWGGLDAAGKPLWRNTQAEALALPGFEQASSNFSVTSLDGGSSYWLVSHEIDLNGGDIIGFPATAPWGFSDSRAIKLYTPPEGDKTNPFYAFHYDARVHQGYESEYPGRVVISYNVNSSSVSIGCGSLLDRFPDIYRPRFITVPVASFRAADARPLTRTVASTPFSPAVATGTDTNWYNKARPYPGPDAVPALDNQCPKPLASKKVALRATPQADGAVQLSWDSYGHDVWYWVDRRESGSQTWTTMPLWSTGTSYRDAPLTGTGVASRTFQYRVRPFGRSAPADVTFTPSDPVTTTAKLQKPAAPTGVRATTPSTKNGSVTVHWSGVTSPSASVYYRVSYWRPAAGQTRATATPISYIAPDARSRTITGLVRGASYRFTVQAFNTAGDSPDSVTVSAIP